MNKSGCCTAYRQISVINEANKVTKDYNAQHIIIELAYWIHVFDLGLNALQQSVRGQNNKTLKGDEEAVGLTEHNPSALRRLMVARPEVLWVILEYEEILHKVIYIMRKLQVRDTKRITRHESVENLYKAKVMGKEHIVNRNENGSLKLGRKSDLLACLVDDYENENGHIDVNVKTVIKTRMLLHASHAASQEQK
ncbi:hypothetical protein GQR58_015939 [Nymphon striatum]|nr:hypothetical protein GQR58_015939 [Nymphon striatum]